MSPLLRFVILLLLANGIRNALPAQELLYLQNPSFEDTARHSKVPHGWLDGGFPGESPPDIGPTRFFRADTKPSAGATHLVLITRDAGTWERVGNRLSQPLRADQCYSWEIDLARSPVYLSQSRTSGLTINFNEPVVLRIWGGYQATEPHELLAMSTPVDHDDWRRYAFTLRPSQDYPLLILEAMYQRDATAPYAGNLLLDNASAVKPLNDCEVDRNALRSWVVPLEAGDSHQSEVTQGSNIDTAELEAALSQLIAGRIDIGLYAIATSGANRPDSKLILLLRENEKEYPLLTLKLLRKRLKAMGVNGRLKVVRLSSKHNLTRLLAEKNNGQLQVWESNE